MQALLTLTRRELAAYFCSFTGYVIIAAGSFLMGLSFVLLIWNLGSEASPMPVTEMFYLTLFFWIILLLLTPVITMRLFALERFSGTFETLMTTPVGDMQVVLAKFIAAQLFYIVMWLPLLVCLYALRYFNHDSTGMDAGAIGATFLGIFLLGCAFVSLGCFASAITRSQAVAAIVSLAGGVSLFLLSFAPRLLPAQSHTLQAQVLSSVALLDQMHDFARGVVDTRPVIVYLSLTFFFLFLTLRAVESRRWK